MSTGGHNGRTLSRRVKLVRIVYQQTREALVSQQRPLSLVVVASIVRRKLKIASLVDFFVSEASKLVRKRKLRERFCEIGRKRKICRCFSDISSLSINPFPENEENYEEFWLVLGQSIDAVRDELLELLAALRLNDKEDARIADKIDIERCLGLLETMKASVLQIQAVAASLFSSLAGSLDDIEHILTVLRNSERAVGSMESQIAALCDLSDWEPLLELWQKQAEIKSALLRESLQSFRDSAKVNDTLIDKTRLDQVLSYAESMLQQLECSSNTGQWRDQPSHENFEKVIVDIRNALEVKEKCVEKKSGDDCHTAESSEKKSGDDCHTEVCSEKKSGDDGHTEVGGEKKSGDVHRTPVTTTKEMSDESSHLAQQPYDLDGPYEVDGEIRTKRQQASENGVSLGSEKQTLPVVSQDPEEDAIINLNNHATSQAVLGKSAHALATSHGVVRRRFSEPTQESQAEFDKKGLDKYKSHGHESARDERDPGQDRSSELDHRIHNQDLDLAQLQGQLAQENGRVDVSNPLMTTADGTKTDELANTTIVPKFDGWGKVPVPPSSSNTNPRPISHQTRISSSNQQRSDSPKSRSSSRSLREQLPPLDPQKRRSTSLTPYTNTTAVSESDGFETDRRRKSDQSLPTTAAKSVARRPASTSYMGPTRRRTVDNARVEGGLSEIVPDMPRARRGHSPHTAHGRPPRRASGTGRDSSRVRGLRDSIGS